jgi:hypothetical protein
MSSSSKSANTTTNNVTNYSLQGMESAETVVAGDGNVVTTTDHGAVENAFGFGESALEFAGDVVGSNERVTTNAINQNSALAGQLAGQTIGFAADAIEENYDFSSGVLDKTIASSTNTTNAIKDLANSLASGGSSDAIESSTKMVYTLGAVFAVVMFGFILMMGSKK